MRYTALLYCIKLISKSFDVIQVPNRASVYGWCSYAANALTEIWYHPYYRASWCSRFRHWWGALGQITADTNGALGGSCFVGFCFTSKNKIWTVSIPFVQFNGYVHFSNLICHNFMVIIGFLCSLCAAKLVTCMKFLLARFQIWVDNQIKLCDERK